MKLDLGVLIFSDVEKTSLSVIDSSLAPLRVAILVLNLVFSVSFARDDHEKILKILSEKVVLSVALQDLVNIVDMHFLLHGNLGLKKAHLMHYLCCKVKVKNLFSWVNLGFAIQNLS